MTQIHLRMCGSLNVGLRGEVLNPVLPKNGGPQLYSASDVPWVPELTG
jgi:hypothetical protein